MLAGDRVNVEMTLKTSPKAVLPSDLSKQPKIICDASMNAQISSLCLTALLIQRLCFSPKVVSDDALINMTAKSVQRL